MACANTLQNYNNLPNLQNNSTKIRMTNLYKADKESRQLRKLFKETYFFLFLLSVLVIFS